MPTITILNHGTMNASGDELVITKLKEIMVGIRGGSRHDNGTATWMLNTGVGSFAQAMDRGYMAGWNSIGGIFWAKGLNKNVEESLAFIKQRVVGHQPDNVTVNLAGHSRGSMTALKIAHGLQEDNSTRGCRVNLFLIDPVPGNLGWVNSGMYKNIAVSGNVKNAYMILAESERRNAFRPYIDKCFLYDMPTHRMDTIPGNHGGINEVSHKKHSESAKIVLHHAVTFLEEHGTPLNGNGGAMKQNPAQLLELYGAIMLKFQKYKNQGAASANLAFFATGGTSRGDRKLQVHNSSKKVGLLNVPNLEKNKFDGKEMKGMQQHVSSLSGLSRESRYFANYDHKRIFRQELPAASHHIERLESSYNQKAYNAMMSDAAFLNELAKLGAQGQMHFLSWRSQIAGEG
ncbi:MAG TPA: hypothetical protein VL096_07065 [Pirellulaceae bacterium]|nr:hypothetical protein [Pirellulaceae bacterium]